MYGFSFFILLIFIVSTNADGKASPYPNGNPDKNGPGVSACRYDGGVSQEDCKEDPMSRHELPPECTAMFVYGWEATMEDNKLVFTDYMKHKNYNYLQDFKDEGRVAYVYYTRISAGEWLEVFDDEGKQATLEMNYIKSYPNTEKIRGLVFTNIFVNDACFPKKSTCNLIKYLTIMKTAREGLQIALQLSAASIMKLGSCKEGLDFQALNEIIDFYSIDFEDFNPCIDDYIKTGITPMNGPGNNLVNLSKNLKTLGIPKNKLYFEFSISPTVLELQKAVYPICFIRYTKICENKVEGIDKWCADTTCSFREKGKYAKENGAGFIAKYIDASDRNIACNCYDNKFPTFFYVLDGWYDMNKDKTCPLIDRIFPPK